MNELILGTVHVETEVNIREQEGSSLVIARKKIILPEGRTGNELLQESLSLNFSGSRSLLGRPGEQW
jgi:hypothetical protein